MGLITDTGNQDRGTLEAASSALEGIFESTGGDGAWLAEGQKPGNRANALQFHKRSHRRPLVSSPTPGRQRASPAPVLLVQGPVRAEKQALA